MLTDFIKIGANEIANSARLSAYVAALGSPLTGGSVCACPTLTAEVLGDDPYTTPDDPANPAPWYDADVPDSGQFLGFMPLTMEGIDDYPVTRQVTSSVSGSGSIGTPRVAPRTVVVTGLLLGNTCCAVEYGLHWLAEALQGCNGGCNGDCVSMYTCCPPEGITPVQYNARYKRTYRRVALTSGPNVIARNGGGGSCQGTCGGGADIVTVEFVLTAATPWAWTDPEPLLDVSLPEDDDETCVEWCTTSSVTPECVESCNPTDCDALGISCSDPRYPATALPDAGSAPQSGSCVPLATTRTCYDIDLSDRPAWSVDALTLVLSSGSTELRNVTISLFVKRDVDLALPCSTVADQNPCGAIGSWNVSYVPANSSITLDGQIGRATLECGGECTTARNVYGPNGAPPLFPTLGCATYCLCIETDLMNPPGIGSSLTASVSGKGL